MPNELTLLPDDIELTVTRSQLTRLMLESHRKAANSVEEIMCLKEIGKVNGLYETKKENITINIEQHIQRIEKLSDEELLKMLGEDAPEMELLPIEGECEVIGGS